MTEISETVDALKKCRKVFIVTGAGLSADSGLPTYRGISGLYEGGETEDGIPVEIALSGETLRKKPEITWKYLSRIEEKCRGASFNRGHEVIAEMERFFEKVTVLTQNVDGFHKTAGSTRVIDIHGDIHEISCENCAWEKTLRDFTEINMPPQCPSCGSAARPTVVFFGEQLPVKKVEMLYREMREGFDVCFSIGTSSLFAYVQEPVIYAHRRGWKTVEINPSVTELSDVVDIRIKKRAAEALDEIWRVYFS